MSHRRRFVSSNAEPAGDVKTSRARPSPSAFQGLPSGASMAAMKRGWHAPSTEHASVPVHAASKRGFRPPTHDHVESEHVEPVVTEAVVASVAPVAPVPVAPVAPVSVVAPAPVHAPSSGGRRRGSSSNFGGSGPSVSAATRRGWRPPDASTSTAPGGLLATRRGYVPPDASSSVAATVAHPVAPAPVVAAAPPVEVQSASHGASRRRGYSSATASSNTVAAASRRGYQQPRQDSMGSSSVIAGVKRGWKPPEESSFTHQPVPSIPSQEGVAAADVRRAAYQAALAEFQAQALVEKQRISSEKPEKSAEMAAAEEAKRALLATRERILASGGILPAVANAVATATEAVSLVSAVVEPEPAESIEEVSTSAVVEPEPAELPAESIEEVDDEIDVPEDDADLLEEEDAFAPDEASREDLIAFLVSRGIERLGRQHVRSVKSERLRSEAKRILATVSGIVDDEAPSP